MPTFNSKLVKRAVTKARKQAGVPPVPQDLPVEHQAFFGSLRENLVVRMGQEGDPLEKAVTFRDMETGGFSISGGVGGASVSPPPPDDPFDYSPPPAITNLAANGGFDIIFLTWDSLVLSYNYYVEVWRSPVNALDLAGPDMKLIGTSKSPQYVDNLNGDRTIYYYWVRIVKAIGSRLIYGPFNQTAGTPGQITLDPAYVIEAIQGQIGESELAAELLTPIQSIPTIQTTLGTHGARLDTAEAALADIMNAPAYDTTTSYIIGDVVSYNGSTWKALVAMAAPAPTPVEGANWTKVGEFASFSDQVSANTVSINNLDTRVTNTEGTVTAHGTDITALQTRVTDTETATSGNSTAIGTLGSRVTLTETGLAANSSDITLLQTSVGDLQIPAFDANKVYVVGEFFTNADTVYEVIATQVAPNAAPPNATYYTARPDYASVTDVALAKSTALSLLDSRVVAAEGTITTHSSDITQLQTDVQNLDPTGSAAALQELDVRVTANETDIAATATDVTNLSATVGGHTSALQTKAEVTAVQNLEDDITVLSAQYTVKLDVSGRVAGIGLANTNGASQFVVASDAVYFIDPGQSIFEFNPATNYTSMQQLRDTQLVFGYANVEGQKRFVINAPAYIEDGTITTAMIKNATITQGQIVNLNVAATDITVANIWEFAGFGGVLQSIPFTSGSTGWRLTQGGDFEASNAVIRGHVEMTTGFISDSVQIGGLGGFAYKNSVFYNEVMGTKPPADADRTSSNVALDTARVAGTPATTVRDDALRALVEVDGKARVYRQSTTPTGARVGDLWLYTGDDRLRQFTGSIWPVVADLTSQNTSADTSKVGGQWASIVRDQAAAAGATTNRVNSWVRPYTTLIDGNKIFTGDAYVDTLQIKGQAVTFPRGVSTAGSQLLNYSGWTNAQSISMTLTGAPVIVNVSAVLSTSDANSHIAVQVVCVSVSRFPRLVIFNPAQGFVSPYIFSTSFYLPNPGAGYFDVFLQFENIGNKATYVSHRNISVIEAKR